jgi:hypothetical protein
VPRCPSYRRIHIHMQTDTHSHTRTRILYLYALELRIDSTHTAHTPSGRPLRTSRSAPMPFL